MKSEKNILVAFLLNLSFSVFELFGGLFTNSVAIMSDAIHDIGDAASIGISYFLEKKSKKHPDKTHTFGYLRYSVVGSVITTVILLVGSLFVVINAVSRLLTPQDIHYNGMLFFAVIGLAVNAVATYFTRDGDSLNQKAVNLHMFEDVLGWAVVLIGAVVMRFTAWKWIDPVLSIGVAIYIFIHAFSHLKEALDLFLVKAPHGMDIDDIAHHVKEIDGVLDVHHVHAWSMDGNLHYATMHVVTNREHAAIKKAVKEALHHHGIVHATLELENEHEHCEEEHCHPQTDGGHHHGHHHHH